MSRQLSRIGITPAGILKINLEKKEIFLQRASCVDLHRQSSGRSVSLPVHYVSPGRDAVAYQNPHLRIPVTRSDSAIIAAFWVLACLNVNWSNAL